MRPSSTIAQAPDDAGKAPAQTETDQATEPQPPPQPEAPATDQPQAPLDEKDPAIAAAHDAYEAFSQAFLQSDWDLVNEQAKTIRRHLRYLTPQQRQNIAYARRTAKQFQPRWWKSTISLSNVSFDAEIWGRRFKANYVPSGELGFQIVVPETEQRIVGNRIYTQIVRLIVIVTWKPSLVNNAQPADGKLAEIQGLRLGDVGEVIVWHELGHNYITNFLPMQHVITLYDDYRMLFRHLQEFYADMTAIYHASPRARRAAMMLRLYALDRYTDDDEYTRAAHAIGSLFLANVLQNPQHWPSVHLPPGVPDQQVEVNTIIYVYEHWDPHWSISEAKALRELVGNFIRRYGEKTLRQKGVLSLPNKLRFSLMAAQDRKYQQQRDQWVAQRLERAIQNGRADTLGEDEQYDPPQRGQSRQRDKSKDKLRITWPD
ncbi:MAG: hypothetical protein V3U29_04345 [Phycisphaeraceae bacterium]